VIIVVGVKKEVYKLEQAEWYEQQIRGLYLILDDAEDKDFMISREYVKEKIRMIISEVGINFHPVIKHAIGMKTDTILDENDKN